MNGNGQFGNLGGFNYEALQNPELMKQLLQQGTPLWQPTGGPTSNQVGSGLGSLLGMLPAAGGVPGAVLKNTIMPTAMGQDWQSAPQPASDLPSLLEQMRQAYPDDQPEQQSSLKNFLAYMSSIVNKPPPGMMTGPMGSLGTRG